MHVHTDPSGAGAGAGLRARRRIAWRLLPLLFVTYVVCYVDRANVSFANLRMSADLGFSDGVYGLGVDLFFVGYVLFEVPRAIIVERWSARKWLARIMISWGLVTMLNGAVRTVAQFYAARLLVGIAEASFFPGVIVYLTHWFPQRDRAKAIACFYAAVPTASIAGSLLAGWLIDVRWQGVAGWRWLFVIEGIAPIALGFVTLVAFTDRPQEARWLPADERQWISDELEAELRTKTSVRTHTMWQAIFDRRILLLLCVYVLALTSAQASTYWLPTFIKRLSGLPVTRVAFLAALPGLVGIVAMLFNGWHSDKTGERRWHTAIPLACAGVAYLLLPLQHGQFSREMVLLVIGGGLMFAYYPVFWSMPTAILSESAAAACFGFINAIGHTGGFVGPVVVGYLNDRTGSLEAAFAFIGASYVLAACLVSLLDLRSESRRTFPSQARLDFDPADCPLDRPQTDVARIRGISNLDFCAQCAQTWSHEFGIRVRSRTCALRAVGDQTGTRRSDLKERSRRTIRHREESRDGVPWNLVSRLPFRA
jgi:ACS family tartrate transporter-like MFS transporter